jgi:hypothetical protein
VESTRVARCAGTKLAHRAAANSTATTSAKVAGVLGLRQADRARLHCVDRPTSAVNLVGQGAAVGGAAAGEQGKLGRMRVRYGRYFEGFEQAGLTDE